jgi:formamidopyrimidine-DNA glycosylase
MKILDRFIEEDFEGRLREIKIVEWEEENTICFAKITANQCLEMISEPKEKEMSQQKVYVEKTQKNIKLGLLISRIILGIGIILLCTPLFALGIGVILGSIVSIARYQIMRWWHHA